MAISLVLLVFGHKCIWQNKLSNLLIVLDANVNITPRLVQFILRNKNVCNKCHGNPFKCCCDTSLITTNVNLIVAPEEKSGEYQNH